MSIGRREFLSLMGIGTAIAAIAPEALANVSGDVFWNRRLRLEVTKPGSWSFLSIVDFETARNATRLSPNDEAARLIAESKDLPVLLMAKYRPDEEPERHIVTPCVYVYDETYDDADLEDEFGDRFSATELHDGLIHAYSNLLRDLRVKKPPAECFVGSVAASRAIWEYDYENESGWSADVSVRNIVVLTKGRFQNFFLMEGASGSRVATLELDWIERSIRYRS